MAENRRAIELKRERLKQELLNEEQDKDIILRLKESIARHKTICKYIVAGQRRKANNMKMVASIYRERGVNFLQ